MATDNTGQKSLSDASDGVKEREQDRQEAELDGQQDLNQGMATGTHSSTRSGVNWGRSYRGKLVPDKKTAAEPDKSKA